MVEKIDNLIEQLRVPLDDSRFSSRLYALFAKKRKKEEEGVVRKIILDEFEDLTRYLEKTPIQEPAVVRHHIRACRLGQALFSTDGKLIESELDDAIAALEEGLYFVGPLRHLETPRREYLLRTLRLFKSDKKLRKKLEQLTQPMMNPIADGLIRATLRLPPGTSIRALHAKQAALSACFSYLRQNVGSCFATAPAILILHEQIDNFLTDIQLLFTKGQLTRTFGGVEYHTPLSFTWGAAELHRPFVVNRNSTLLWEVPGFISAFEATGLIESTANFHDKSDLIKNLLKGAFNLLFPRLEAFHTNAEQLLRGALLFHHHLTEEDLQQQTLRVRKTLPVELMGRIVQNPSDEGSKATRTERFKSDFENACNAYKSLTDCALLKAWEYTLASFSEVKHEFSHWNLYSSLGMDYREPFGVAAIFYQLIGRKVESLNAQTRELQVYYEQKFHEVKRLETQMQRGDGEQDYRWAKAEYQARVGELNRLLNERDISHDKAHRFANMHNFVMEHFDRKFSEYFQEVYDADIREIQGGLYDDSPAGFRLLYKHGRNKPSSWTFIYTHEQYIDVLCDFFGACDRDFSSEPEVKGLEKEFSECISEVVSMIKSNEFLEASFVRMARAHNVPLVRDPLNNIDKVTKKPWVYTSGGTMKALLSCYYFREAAPTEKEFACGSPFELLSKLIEIAKQMPVALQKRMDDEPFRHLIMHSPTHAFLFMPGLSPFKNAWKSPLSPDDWIQREFISPYKSAVEKILLEGEEMHMLIDLMLDKVPLVFQKHFKSRMAHFPQNMTCRSFREYIIKIVESDPFLIPQGRPVLHPEEIDSTLFHALPFSSRVHLREHLERIFKEMYKISPKCVSAECLQFFEQIESKHCAHTTLPAHRVRDICLSVVLIARGKSSAPYDYSSIITQAMRNCGLALPEPLRFADTNWLNEYFSFVVNPGTGNLELWRTDYAGISGVSMSSWNDCFDPNQKRWGVYINPYEYGS